MNWIVATALIFGGIASTFLCLWNALISIDGIYPVWIPYLEWVGYLSFAIGVFLLLYSIVKGLVSLWQRRPMW